ncbi:MAG: DNA polymerase III subunit [Bacteroidales bacterium]
MLFQQVIGQQEVKQRLLNLVQEDRTPHALMLHGPSGSGKLALAVAMMQYIACRDRQVGDACGTCPSCVKFRKLVHPDLHFVFPVLKTSKVTKDPVSDLFMEEWRVAFTNNPYLSENDWYEHIGAENKQGIINKEESLQVIRKLGFKPYESEFRMMIIWFPEKMNQPAANKLLKLIEEPPENTVIIMVSEQTDRILPTILSRTQLMHIPPLTASEIREGLMEREPDEPERIEDAVRRSNGNFNMALQTLREDQREQQYFDHFTSLMRLCYARNIIEINDWVEQIAGIGRERQKQLLEYALRILRESFIFHLGNDDLNYMSVKERSFVEKFSPFIHQGNIHELAAAFDLAVNHIEANGNPRIILMDLSIGIIKLLMVKAPQPT